MVGLETADCFALATYKIYGALQKQEEERLPYFFAIVGVPNLTGEAVGRQIPSFLVETVALIDQAPRGKSKRDIEDAAVESLVRAQHTVYGQTLDRIHRRTGTSSRRDGQTSSCGSLFDRVFALKIRNFSRAFRGAELDMHFSLARDLIPLRNSWQPFEREASSSSPR